ncbi:DUF465 domain-containing protein [Pseudomonas sp. RIT-PI-AD]|uniref:YdcH family protein n=1 Tax=Pseudomonas sp. RIT-PI-AD TaxID=3035294 RepID=UPI0021D83484|nr:DUF465 domain-containing protein [Pseudomonas sp. RIT-PI-AD]
MPVQHDLAQDFPEFGEALKTLARTDAEFGSLLERYQRLDKTIVEAERAANLDDDKLNQLRRERVLTKDKIARKLERA